MEITTFARLVLVYAHLLLCVFALHDVLATDLRVLQRRVDARMLRAVEQRIRWLLPALCVTGLLIAGIDLGFDPTRVGDNPKLLAKLCAVGVLIANGFLLRRYCFPRIADGREMGPLESSAVMALGAVSTSSWLMAAFFGVAKPLLTWPPRATLGLYAAVVLVAVATALLMGTRLRRVDDTAAWARG